MVSHFLRKRRPRSSSRTEEVETPLRHSLSLPDLTTPLLDPESWEELPLSLAFNLPSSPNASTSHSPQAISPHTNPALTRGRKVSLVNVYQPGSPVQFHRPFTPWQVVPTPSTISGSQTYPFLASPDNDFRTSHAKWTPAGHRASVQTTATSNSLRWERKGRKSRVAGRLNVVVVGGKSVGKTSFASFLIDSCTPSTSSPKPRPTLLASPAEPTFDTPSSPTAPGPPLLHPIKTPSHASLSPTTKLTSRLVTVSLGDYERTLLRVIDTPGLAMGTDAVQEKERERGVTGLLRLLEERFADVMREESRIVRRTTRGEDDLIHLVIYLIDARSVLQQPVEVTADWSAVGVFDEAMEEGESSGILEARLAESEIAVLRQLSLRSNVLPILTRTDGLAVSELDTVRSAVKRDLAKAFPNDGGFGIFAHEDEEEAEHVKTPTPSDGTFSPEPEQPDNRPPTPASTITPLARLPFAMFNPELPCRTPGSYLRRFAWGDANVLDPEHTDFQLLREAILDTHTKALRTSTREVFYERYRTERLLAKQKV